MPDCPSCHRSVSYNIFDNWFACPICNHWVRLRTNQNGTQWLQAGYLKDGHIEPAQISYAPSLIVAQPDAGRVRRSESTSNRITVLDSNEGWSSAPASVPNGLIIVSGAILMGIGILVYCRLIGLQLLSNMYVPLLLVAIVGGFLTRAIAQFGR